MAIALGVSGCCCDNKVGAPKPATYRRGVVIGDKQAWEYNGGCQDSPNEFPDLQFTSLGRIGANRYAWQGFLEYLGGSAPTPPATNASLIELQPRHKVLMIVSGAFDDVFEVGPTVGDVEIRMLKLIADFSLYDDFCVTKDDAAAYYTTIPTAAWFKGFGTPGGFGDGGGTFEFDISDLIDEVRTSAEYASFPDTPPLFEIRPAANWDADYFVFALDTVQSERNHLVLQFS